MVVYSTILHRPVHSREIAWVETLFTGLGEAAVGTVSCVILLVKPYIVIGFQSERLQRL